MKLAWIVAATAFLASCGADGEPVTPTAQNELTLSNGGIALGSRIGATNVTLGVAL